MHIVITISVNKNIGPDDKRTVFSSLPLYTIWLLTHILFVIRLKIGNSKVEGLSAVAVLFFYLNLCMTQTDRNQFHHFNAITFGAKCTINYL